MNSQQFANRSPSLRNGQKIPVVILGATGMVGQRFVSLLTEHPWFEICGLAASPQSAGKSYSQATMGRWTLPNAPAEAIATMPVLRVSEDCTELARMGRIAFCALDMPKEDIIRIETAYAQAGVAVISNNSAHRGAADVPMLLPEVNSEHAACINVQRKARGWSSGLIAVKPNCSIQSYVPILAALSSLDITEVNVTTLQAVSGAGKTLADWPAMTDNVIPFIRGEEEKSEQEPLKVFGTVGTTGIVPATRPSISATCIRVPVSDGHMASITFTTARDVALEEVLSLLKSYRPPEDVAALPSSPHPFLQLCEEEDRPQTRDDRTRGNGMTVSVGRVRKLGARRWSCIGLSHNTVRGAAGGAVLMAELLASRGFIVVE